MGYDPDFSQQEINDLKRFINESGGLALRVRGVLQLQTKIEHIAWTRRLSFLLGAFKKQD